MDSLLTRLGSFDTGCSSVVGTGWCRPFAETVLASAFSTIAIFRDGRLYGKTKEQLERV